MTNKSTLRAPSFHNDILKDQHHSMASEPSLQGELDRQRKRSDFKADPQSTTPFPGGSRNRSADHPGQA